LLKMLPDDLNVRLQQYVDKQSVLKKKESEIRASFDKWLENKYDQDQPEKVKEVEDLLQKFADEIRSYEARIKALATIKHVKRLCDKST
ncbi:hypothetical protein BGZ58_007988, partial [Dissophora ornata]